ncbi:hypothetical protein N7490_010541 [Penicillium lividum]|nr:hypothetical protein N7490_010541 [Penicillium lividum]
MDTGVITNLFSQDLSLIDGELPQSLTNTTLQICIAAGGAAVIATSSPYIIITYPFVVLILFGVQRFYLRTSRQLRLLDLEAKSPLYTHFLDTINGTVTLRAFGWTEDSVVFNCGLLDISQRPAYQLIILTTQLRSSTGLTGASLVSIMGFGRAESTHLWKERKDPTFFPDRTTFKKNLDPFDAATLDECHAALQTDSQPTRSATDRGSYSTWPERFYAGESVPASSMQSGVLILDEINSSVDTETQKVMLEIIWRQFERYTVVMVSHRLDMVMRFDKVLVLDHGKLVEEGSPVELIEEDGWFRDLWMAGKTEH